MIGGNYVVRLLVLIVMCRVGFGVVGFSVCFSSCI